MAAEYPFADFRRHVHDLMHRRMVRRSEDQEAAFTANVLRIRDYLSEFYDGDDLAQNVVLLVAIYRHITANATAYDTGLLGIRTDDGIHVSDALQFAVHWYYTSRPPAEWDSPDAITKIKEKANDWRSSDA